MGRKTHGPYLIAAIEYNEVEKVNEIITKQFRNRKTIADILVSELHRLASERTDVPLLLAASLPDPTILKYFVVKCKANINHVFEHGGQHHQRKTTALFTAVQRGLHDTVNAILTLNADANAADHKGRRPLHQAIRRADYRVAKMLLSHGAQTNLADLSGNTALHTATIYGHTELVKLLLQHGADVYKKGQHGALAIHMAAKEGHANLVRLFCQFSEVNPNIKVPCYDAKDKAPLHVAAERGHSETVFTLLEHCGAGVDVRDAEGETPLHCAVLNEYDSFGMKSKDDHTETVKLLLNYGADPNSRNARGETPLHLATRNEFQKVIEVLILAGCDPSAEDRDGNKAIDLTSDDDAVSKQTLQHATENRERYLSESMEVRARGFSTTTQSQAALPLSIQSSSLHGMPVLLGAAPGLPTLTRAASTPGLFAMPPQSTMMSSAYGRHNGSIVTPFGSRSQLAALTQLSGSMSPTSTCQSGVVFADGQMVADGFQMSQLIGRQYSLPNGSQIDVGATVSLGGGSRVMSPMMGDVESTSMYADDAQSVVSTVPSLRNFLAARHQRRPSSEDSSLWDVTPMSSVHNSNLDVRDGSLRRRSKRKVIKSRADIPKPESVKVAQHKNIVPKVSKPPIVFSKADSVSDINSVSTDVDDSVSDADSFETVSEISENVKQQRTGRLNGSVTRQASNVQDWLEEQTVMSEHSTSRSVSSETTTESSGASSSAPPPSRPPRVVRTPTAIVEGVKRRPPPPVPEKKFSYSAKKSTNQIKMPDEIDEEVAEVETEELKSPDETMFEVEMDDSKYSGKTVFSIIPVWPAAPKKTHIISNKAAKEAVSKFDDDLFIDRLSQGDFSWSGVSCMYTGDSSDPNVVTVSMSCPQRWRFVQKIALNDERIGKKKNSTARWDKMPLSPGHKVLRKNSKSNSDGVPKLLENEVTSIKNKHSIAFMKPEDEIEEDCSSSESSGWSAEEMDGSKHNSSRLQINVKLPVFEDASARQPSPELTSPPVSQFSFSQRGLVFEKVPQLVRNEMSGNIAQDYLFHRSIAGLTSATEQNIMQRVNESMESPVVSNKWNAAQLTDVELQRMQYNNGRNHSMRSNSVSNSAAQFDRMHASELQRQRELQLLEMQQRQQQQQQKQLQLQQQQQLAMEIARQQQEQLQLQQQQQELRQQQYVVAEAVLQQPEQHQTSKKAARKQMQQQQQLAAEAAARKHKSKHRSATQENPPSDQPVEVSAAAVAERRSTVERERAGSVGHVRYRDRTSGGSQASIRDRTSDSSQASYRNSSQIYEELPETTRNKRISIHSDEFVLQYGKNIRYLSIVCEENPGFTVCGGNISGTFVLKVDSNSSAAKAGLTVGDQIVGINNKFVKSLSKEEIYHVFQQQQQQQQPTSESLIVVVARDDDRFRLASTKNAVGDSFFVRAHFNYTPSTTKKGELPVKEEDIFVVSDSMPDDRVGFWQAKKVVGNFHEPEGYIPNRLRAEKIVTTQRLMMHPDAVTAKQRGGVLMRSFRRSKSTDRSGNRGEVGSTDSKPSSEAGDVMTYERVVQQKSPTKRPVVLMGLFCDAVCAKLAKDSPGIYEFPNVEVERYGQVGDDMQLDLTVIRSIVNRGKHCVMVISPKAVNFVRDKTEFRPIVVYLSPVSKSVVASVKERLAPALDKKIGVMFDEATKFEKYHAGLFDAIVPYKSDSSWFSLLKETVDRFQRQPQWTPVEVSVPDLDGSDSSPDIIKTTRGGDSKGRDAVKHVSLTTDDIPDQIQDLMTQAAADSRTLVDSRTETRLPNDYNNNQNGGTAERQPKKSILKSREKHNRSLASIDFKISEFQTKPTVAVKPPRAAIINQYTASPRKPYNSQSHTTCETLL